MPRSLSAARSVGALLVLSLLAAGCTRSKYRLAADHEAYHTIAERNGDPRWQANNVSIEIDSRSRYFDNYSADCPPMPQDDPTAARYMRSVNGTKGWKHWWDNGVRTRLENPDWQARLAEYMEINEEGAVELDVDSALRLAYVHSPNHQTQLESLYLSSLDVTTERFRLDTQYFAGYDVNYDHQGRLIPPALRFEPTLGRFVVNPAIEGVESNRLAVGRPFAGNPAFQVSRQFATAGTLLAGFANSFVFEFKGDNANLASSLLNFSFVQPLLRGGGRDIALEQLTFDERTLLANLRSYAQFRQGFYTQVAIGELGVTGPQRFGRGTGLQIFSGQAGLGGYVGLLQQLQQIRNSEDNLSLQLRTLAQLEALLDAGVIDLVQVDQFRQNVENERANLLQSQNNYLTALDSFKTRTLGLPPDLKIDLDDTLIRQFQLVDRDATAVQDAIADLQDRVGQLAELADTAAIRALQSEVVALLDPMRVQLDAVNEDLAKLQDARPRRTAMMTPEQTDQFTLDLEQLDDAMADLENQFAEVEASASQQQALQAQSAEIGENEIRDTVILLRNMLRIVQGSILVQARSRLEAVTVESIDLSSEDAFRIALVNRLDFMNGRASLVDSWRLIQVNADALQSVLTVRADGDMRTARNNPLSFRAPTSTVRLGMQFDAPLTRLIERNNYRESLINYQRSRRDLIQSRDQLHLGLRILLRQIEQLRTNLEIQRRAVAIAIRRVDLTRAALYAPVPPPRPGQRAAQFGPTAAINLLSAQSALRDTQNNFLSVWLNYYAVKMRLARELGTMQLDTEGRWMEAPLPNTVEDSLRIVDPTQLDDPSGEGGSGGDVVPIEDLPPDVPAELMETVDALPDDFTFEAPEQSAQDNVSMIEAP